MTRNTASATIAAAGGQSARETAARVAAGGVARGAAALVPGLKIRGALVQMGRTRSTASACFDWDEIERTTRSGAPTAAIGRAGPNILDELAQGGQFGRRGDRGVPKGVPAGLGAPIYGKLDADLAAAMMSINAVKGVEIGEGLRRGRADRRGERRRDAHGQRRPEFLSNHAGGILGGISTGQPVVCRFAVKPTSSILTPVPDAGSCAGRARGRPA
jgi:chorismate synthase